jgi:hypothetical protein
MSHSCGSALAAAAEPNATPIINAVAAHAFISFILAFECTAGAPNPQ